MRPNVKDLTSYSMTQLTPWNNSKNKPGNLKAQILSLITFCFRRKKTTPVWSMKWKPGSKLSLKLTRSSSFWTIKMMSLRSKPKNYKSSATGLKPSTNNCAELWTALFPEIRTSQWNWRASKIHWDWPKASSTSQS